jgi:hypothetical protein
MIARLGNVLYWAACLLAILILAVGWTNYQGIDTTGIEAARRRGETDVSILEQQKNPLFPQSGVEATKRAAGIAAGIEASTKAGYSPTEILDFLVKRQRSRLAGLPDLEQDPTLAIAGAAALLVWLLGRALRYVLAGT